MRDFWTPVCNRCKQHIQALIAKPACQMPPVEMNQCLITTRLYPTISAIIKIVSVLQAFASCLVLVLDGCLLHVLCNVGSRILLLCQFCLGGSFAIDSLVVDGRLLGGVVRSSGFGSSRRSSI